MGNEIKAIWALCLGLVLLSFVFFAPGAFAKTRKMKSASGTGDLGPLDPTLKFGVVVNNSTYQIYRSSKLGNSGLKRLNKILQEHHLGAPKTVIYMNYNGYKFPFYFALEEYRASWSGDFGYTFDFYHSFGTPSTYVDGDDPLSPKEDIDAKKLLGKEAKKLFPIVDDGIDGGVNEVLTVINLILDPANQPVLFHCHGGRHRTGMIAMLLRHMQGGHWITGPTKRVLGMDLNPAEYEYYSFNHLMFRKQNIQFVRQFVQDDRFLQLKDTFGNALNAASAFTTIRGEIPEFIDKIEPEEAGDVENAEAASY